MTTEITPSSASPVSATEKLKPGSGTAQAAAPCAKVVDLLKSVEFRLKAEEAELMARTVSYLPDREWFASQARAWRLQEAEALASEATPPA